jgi:hypothetical protein
MKTGRAIFGDNQHCLGGYAGRRGCTNQPRSCLMKFSHESESSATTRRWSDSLLNKPLLADPGFESPHLWWGMLTPRISYDYTTMECPEAQLDFSDKTLVTLRVLDVEKLSVVKRDYHLVRIAHYMVAGKEYPCRIVDYSDLNKKTMRWTT